MPILPAPNQAYTELDFDSLRARLYNVITSVFPDWSEDAVASFGNVLLELMCFVGDVCGFTIDNRLREGRITEATLRESVVKAAKLLRYTPKTATAATVDEVITLAAVPTNDVVFPAGTVVKTLSATSPISFQMLTALTIQAGANPPQGTVTCENSETHTASYPATGLAHQSIRLAATPYLDSNTVVTAANGLYTQVDNLLGSLSTDRHYIVTVDDDDRAKITFGDGTYGVIPTGTIAITYKTGGGYSGNVDANSIRKIPGAFTDAVGNTVVVSCTNPEKASGGAPRESRAQIQAAAPASTRVQRTTVSREDYEINALRVPGVARALMLTSDQYPAIAENTGRLYIVPTGGGVPSSTLKVAVLQMVTVTYPNTITFKVSVEDTDYLVVDVLAVVYARKGTNKQTLAATILANLQAYFALTTATGTEDEADNPNVNFGYYASQDSEGVFDGTLALSDIRDVVRDTSGVRKLGAGLNDFLLNGAHTDLTTGIAQFPVLGTLTLIDGETNATLGA